MFKFSTTHVLNSIADVVPMKFDGTTYYAWDTSDFATGTTTKPSTGDFAAWTSTQWSRFLKTTTGTFLRVGKDNLFDKSTVTSVKVNAPVAGTVASATITLPSLNEGTARLYVYVTNPVNADPLMANDLKRRGKPFYIEFKASETDTDNATTLAAAINSAKGKFILTYDNGPIFTASVSEANVTITASDANYDFEDIRLEQLVDPSLTDEVSDYIYADKVFSAVDATVAYTPLVPAFGTADYILNNLRLPTNANTRWFGDQWDEMPIKGAKYHQYIITVCTERPEVQGMGVIGQYNKSITTHILWVENSINSAFLTMVNKTINPLASGNVLEDAVSGTDKVHSDAATTKA